MVVSAGAQSANKIKGRSEGIEWGIKVQVSRKWQAISKGENISIYRKQEDDWQCSGRMDGPMMGCNKIAFDRNNKKENLPQTTATEAAEKRLVVWDKGTENRFNRQFGV